MATLTKLPGINIINGFKGVVDFYVHCGIPCARRWPRPPAGARAPAVQQQWPAFTFAAKTWTALSPAVQSAYNQLATGTNMTGRDLYVKSYINGSLLYLEDA